MANTKQVKPVHTRAIRLTHPHADRLLHNFLSGVDSLSDSDAALFKHAKATVTKTDAAFELSAVLHGQPASDVPAQALRTEVKAVTFHRFRLWRTGKQLKATVVLDV